jgi:glycosyltransferase involved in cell wall biosynthesis
MQKTTFPVRVCIHDDCSTDKTAEIVREYQKKYPNLIWAYYQIENSYGKPNRRDYTKNFMEWFEDGKYTALCEGDDYWTDPLKLQKQVDFLEGNLDYSLVYQPWVNLYEGNFSEIHSYFPATLGLLSRNIPEIFTHVPKNVLNGDSVFLFFLAFYGKFHCLHDLKPAVKRKDSGGVWNSLSFLEQENNRVNTYLKLKNSTRGTKYHYQAVKKFAAQIIVSGKKIEQKGIDHPLASPIKRFSYAYSNGVFLEYCKQLINLKIWFLTSK